MQSKCHERVRISRRALVATAGAGAACLAGGRARALEPARAAALLSPGDAALAAGAAENRMLAVGPWRDGLWAAVLADDHDVTMVLTDEAGSGVVAGPCQFEALTIDPFWSPTFKVAEGPLGAAWPSVALTVSNSYVSTGRSTGTEAVHLVLRRGAELVPVFGCYLEADHSEVVDCARGHRGEMPCRRSWARAWRLRVGNPARAGEPPTLYVTTPGGAVASVHRWAGAGYRPATFAPV